MKRPNAFENGRNIAEVCPEVPVGPQEQKQAVGVAVPEMIRHQVPSTQGHHKSIGERLEPRECRCGKRQVENPG